MEGFVHHNSTVYPLLSIKDTYAATCIVGISHESTEQFTIQIKFSSMRICKMLQM